MNHIKYNIYLGDIIDAKRADDYTVISLTKHPVDETDLHVPLIDGKNDYHTFIPKIDAVFNKFIECKDNDEDILVHCAVGMSRSPAVVALIISMYESIKYEEAMKIVRNKKMQVNPHYELKKLCNKYLGET